MLESTSRLASDSEAMSRRLDTAVLAALTFSAISISAALAPCSSAAAIGLKARRSTLLSILKAALISASVAPAETNVDSGDITSAPAGAENTVLTVAPVF